MIGAIIERKKLVKEIIVFDLLCICEENDPLFLTKTTKSIIICRSKLYSL